MIDSIIKSVTEELLITRKSKLGDLSSLQALTNTISKRSQILISQQLKQNHVKRNRHKLVLDPVSIDSLDESSRNSIGSSKSSSTFSSIESSVSTTSIELKQPEVLVPTWREVAYKSSYRLEGTENLNDSCYLKRHQKHENEERQIKKWDLRRQKEALLKMKALLRGRSSINNQQVKPNLNNTLPEDQICIKVIDDPTLVNFEFICIVEEKDLIDAKQPVAVQVDPVKIELTETLEIQPKKTPKRRGRKPKPKENLCEEKPRVKAEIESKKKLTKCKSWSSLPLIVNNHGKALNHSFSEFSGSFNDKQVMSVYDDLDLDYKSVDRSDVNLKRVKGSKRKSSQLSTSCMVVNTEATFNSSYFKFPAKKKTRLSMNSSFKSFFLN